MLEGWYCRTMANQEAAINDDGSDESQESPMHAHPNIRTNEHGGVDYKSRYLLLKRKLKFLIYENEYFQDTLRLNQRRLLKISRDRSFLLDRLMQYEKAGNTSSEDDATESSDDETQTSQSQPKETIRKRKVEGKSGQAVVSGATRGRKRKIPLPQGSQTQGKQKKMVHLAQPQQPPQQLSPHVQQQQQLANLQSPLPPVPVMVPTTPNTPIAVEQDIRETHLTTAEITRQLQARKPSAIELMSVECTSATVPATMLSDESPSKCFQNEQPQHYLDGSSPSHVAAEECVPMEYIN